MKLTTEIINKKTSVSLSLEDRVTVLGSCFADEIGTRLADAGFDTLVNPFGTLYNPASIASAVGRLASGTPFTEDDCVEMGAGAGLICSYSHHTSFARPTAEEFLEYANARLAEASGFWQGCSKVIVTLGSSAVWRLLSAEGHPVVSNCLKRPSKEFAHDLLSAEEISVCLSRIAGESGRQYIFTVSPIRYLSLGAHVNTVSKARLHIALDEFLSSHIGCDYFPAYEILLDELRDYRFFADDLVHPSRTAAEIIWERFLDAAVPEKDLPRIAANLKACRSARHRSIHPASR